MPIVKARRGRAGRRTECKRFRGRTRRVPRATGKLDSSRRLIAPGHSLTLPSLQGTQARFQFSAGFGSVLPLVRSLIKEGVVHERHFEAATSPVTVLEKALAEIAHWPSENPGDQFGITLTIADRLEEYRPSGGMLFFLWSNSSDPQYIPLRSIFERLDGNPHQERLMASLYCWLYEASSRVFHPFGFPETQYMYQRRKEYYQEMREEGEDVDLEGEVEFADPAKVIAYIRDADKLTMKREEAATAIASIGDAKLRGAFENARRIYVESRRIKLPTMPEEHRRIVDEAAYYMDGDPVPGLGISHWRDDPIVAWFDQFCQEQFESGVTCRAPIIIGFRPDDTKTFLQIVDALPRMVRVVAGLSDWVRFAEEAENASGNANR
jgi:hypothetical protein